MSQYISPKWNLFVSRPTPLLKREFLKYTYLCSHRFSHLRIGHLLTIASYKENQVFVRSDEDLVCERKAEDDYTQGNSEKYLRKFFSLIKNFRTPRGPVVKQALNAFQTVGATLIYTFYLERTLAKHGPLVRGKNKIRLNRLIKENSRLRDQGARLMYGLYDKFRAQFAEADKDYLLLDEFVKGRKLTAREIEARKKFFVTLVTNKKTVIYTGQRAKEILKEQGFKCLKINRVQEVRGLPISKGKVRGEVIKIKKLADFKSKDCRGKIVVASDVIIEYMPYLKKVLAIVTNYGGITSHVAVVARELRIPCLAGTKIATQIFKDEDLVEVDAEKGVAKLIKRV